MRALVTGGAGFLGSHLVDALLNEGHKVTVVDNLVTGRLENLAHIRSSRLRILRVDASRAPADRYDAVFHLASPASPIAYGRLQRTTLITNAMGTLRTLKIASNSGARYLLTSTSEVYGDPAVHPQPETYWGNVNPVGPRSSYDEGKRFAEALTIAFVRETRLDARIVRIFNTYGPRMRIDDGRMPSTFIVAALKGDPIPVEGSGQQTRSLCYVDDMIRGLLAAFASGRAGQIYNLGNPREQTVLRFAKMVLSASGSTSPIVFVPERSQDIQRRRPDITKARRELRWRPKVSLETGLRRTISEYASIVGSTGAGLRHRPTTPGRRERRAPRSSTRAHRGAP